MGVLLAILAYPYFLSREKTIFWKLSFFTSCNFILFQVNYFDLKERWLSGLKRHGANVLFGLNRTVGSNPTLSALRPAQGSSRVTRQIPNRILKQLPAQIPKQIPKQKLLIQIPKQISKKKKKVIPLETLSLPICFGYKPTEKKDECGICRKCPYSQACEVETRFNKLHQSRSRFRKTQEKLINQRIDEVFDSLKNL